jgi:hypothetical protein
MQRISFAAQQAFTKNMLHDVDTKWIEDSVFDTMTLNVRGRIWAEKAGTYEVKYPADWWQHFKLRWFNHWLLRHYPVRYKTERVDAHVVYKQFVPSMPDKQPHLVIVPKDSYYST